MHSLVSQVKRDHAPIDPYATLQESFLSAVSDDLLFVDFLRAGTSDGFGVGSTVPDLKMSSSWPWEPKRILLIMWDKGELHKMGIFRGFIKCAIISCVSFVS